MINLYALLIKCSSFLCRLMHHYVHCCLGAVVCLWDCVRLGRWWRQNKVRRHDTVSSESLYTAFCQISSSMTVHVPVMWSPSGFMLSVGECLEVLVLGDIGLQRKALSLLASVVDCRVICSQQGLLQCGGTSHALFARHPARCLWAWNSMYIASSLIPRPSQT